jgi:hypothetical protein
VPNLREVARRLAELIIGRLRDAERNVEPGEIQELEALIWKQLPNPERWFTGSLRALYLAGSSALESRRSKVSHG